MADLKIVDVRKSYGKKEVLKGVSLTAGTGEFLALLGPSGCGKTTLLNTISGIVRQDAGQVLVDGRDISHSPIEKRNIGVVFQNYALFPNMTVEQNIRCGLCREKDRRARNRKLDEAVEAMGLVKPVSYTHLLSYLMLYLAPNAAVAGVACTLCGAAYG